MTTQSNAGSVVSAPADPQNNLQAHARSYASEFQYCSDAAERAPVCADPCGPESQFGSLRDTRDTATLEPKGSSERNVDHAAALPKGDIAQAKGLNPHRSISGAPVRCARDGGLLRRLATDLAGSGHVQRRPHTHCSSNVNKPRSRRQEYRDARTTRPGLASDGSTRKGELVGVDVPRPRSTGDKVGRGWGQQPNDACWDGAANSISGPRTTGVMRKGARLKTGNSRCETGFAREYQPSRDGGRDRSIQTHGAGAQALNPYARRAGSIPAVWADAGPVFVARARVETLEAA